MNEKRGTNTTEKDAELIVQAYFNSGVVTDMFDMGNILTKSVDNRITGQLGYSYATAIKKFVDTGLFSRTVARNIQTATTKYYIHKAEPEVVEFEVVEREMTLVEKYNYHQEQMAIIFKQIAEIVERKQFYDTTK